MEKISTVIVYREWTKDVCFYVSRLPCDGGVDYGYTTKGGEAKQLTIRQAKAFFAHCEDVGARWFGSIPGL